MTHPEKLIYRIREAMDTLGVSRSTIYRLVKRSELKLIKIGSTTSSGITAASIKAMIEEVDVLARHPLRSVFLKMPN